MQIGSFLKIPTRELQPGLGAEKLTQLDGPSAPLKTEGTKGGSFSEVLGKAVSDVDTKMQSAGVEQQKLLTGETTNVHQAMIAMQEASVAFSLMVEVRNKLVESYQELMRMQV